MTKVRIPSDFKFSSQPVMRSMVSSRDSWNNIMVKADRIHTLGYYGSGVKWGIIDTGYYGDHPDLQDLPPEQIWTKEFRDPKDKNGHGTHVRGIVEMQHNDKGFRGIAPKSTPYVAKVLGPDGSGSPYFTAEAIRWCADNGCMVVNLSLGIDGIVAEIEEAIDYAWSKGCLCVAAAGNGGKKVDFPASNGKVLAVAALDGNKVVAMFSGRGKEVDVAAPGVAIVSTWIDNDYRPASGTSMAAPHVAGLIILFIEQWRRKFNVDPTPSQMVNAIIDNAEDLGIEGFDEESGFGLAVANFDSHSYEKIEYSEYNKMLALQEYLVKKHFDWNHAVAKSTLLDNINNAINDDVKTIWSLALELIRYFMSNFWKDGDWDISIPWPWFPSRGKKYIELAKLIIDLFNKAFQLIKE